MVGFCPRHRRRPDLISIAGSPVPFTATGGLDLEMSATFAEEDSTLYSPRGFPLGSRELGTNVPFTLEPLEVGPIISDEVRPPGYLYLGAVKQIGADVGGSVAVT